MSLVYQRCLLLAAAMLCAIGGAFAQGSTIKAHLVMNNHKHASKATAQEPNAVVWLTPANGRSDSLPRAQNAGPRPELVQKNKQFTPHVTAVEVGSVVDFPNEDPIFHNVFSLFNGKRFDLGLYEAGESRTVRFDRVGVSYIFCNIHPQMSAVIVTVDTPYYGTSSAEGVISISKVPAGDYELHVFAEGLSSDAQKALMKRVTVSANDVVAHVSLPERESNLAHKNKYGRDYDPVSGDAYDK